ncbi:Coenzyme F420 hydrogenase/dehydrogenase, beta subunit C-terminal domain [Aestuariivirga sp.]|uniref:Coenzyme F420 hydrogenase/dehydrogenase, beta subunit C-terminal domain n=1 Tax=Aestuariivirga sp. TaxID=2650926 RepID=UPI00391A2F7F
MPSADRPAALAPRDVVKAGLCIGCGSCAAAEPSAAMRWDEHGQLTPRGPSGWYRGRSESFARRCPFSPAARDETTLARDLFPGAPHAEERIGRHEACYVGHAAEEPFRAQGSSGGMVSWVAAELLRRRLVDGVLHVAPSDPRATGRLFSYRVSRTARELKAGAKSRYYPVDLAAALREVRERPGRYALVGIPCFIKAVQLLRREDPLMRQRIAFTLGLFCGHMKSARMVESFAWQMGIAPEEIAAAEFRLKDPNRPANWYRAEIATADGRRSSEDWWNLADGDWGAGFFQNPACNWCDDVAAETADIAFGDAWVEPYSSDGRGTNVVVVRTPLLAGVLRQGLAEGRLALAEVDADFVAETQAAGFRHRREGLALRLALRRGPLKPMKRVRPGMPPITARRKLVYLSRFVISAASHRMFRAARALRWPGLYLGWAKGALALYQGLAWSRGRIGRLADRLSPKRET